MRMPTSIEHLQRGQGVARGRTQTDATDKLTAQFIGRNVAFFHINSINNLISADSVCGSIWDKKVFTGGYFANCGAVVEQKTEIHERNRLSYLRGACASAQAQSIA